MALELSWRCQRTTRAVSYTHLDVYKRQLEEALATEEVGIVDAVNLYACGGDGGYLDDQWVVVVVYDDVDTRQSNHLMKLIATLIDKPVAWHEDAHVMPCILYMLWEVTSNMCEVTLGQIGVDFLRYVEYFLVFGSHSDLLSFSTKILKKGETAQPHPASTKFSKHHYKCTQRSGE